MSCYYWDITLGASNVDGRLVSNINRDSDRNIGYVSELIKLDLNGRDENEVIEELFDADSKYGDDLKYPTLGTWLMPNNPDDDDEEDTYNSNSYTNGLVRAVGLSIQQPEFYCPGFIKPIPIDMVQETAPW